ncbi:glycosyltransferase family 4 protein [Rossellomorea aquimaris]|nr:glycosyltransferase family 4 protein [Rossellomorea aquimaris]
MSEDYPSSNNKYAMSYVHSRNLIYKKHFNVSVLSFKSKVNYSYEGINVMSLNGFERSKKNYNILISHAPNIKNHVKFIYKYSKLFRKIIFVIHGHEVLPLNNYYPRNYKYNRSYSKKIIRTIYDKYKIRTLSNLFNKLFEQNKVKFFFVSSWMKEHFLKNIETSLDKVDNNSEIIFNAANEAFINNKYEFDEDSYLADYISIRPLDQPKYGIDLIVKFAESHPDNTFHIYGEGSYFDYHTIPNNVKLIKKFIEQKDIPSLLNKYKCALMPTRLDSQGVMVCEIATYGMPCITSDIPICREMLNEFPNVKFIRNSEFGINNNFNELELKNIKNLPNKFHNNKTVDIEIEKIKITYNA